MSGEIAESTQELVHELRRGLYLPVQQKAADRLCEQYDTIVQLERKVHKLESELWREVVPFGKRE